MNTDTYTRLHLGVCAPCANAARNKARALAAHEAQARVAAKITGPFVGLTVREAITANA